MFRLRHNEDCAGYSRDQSCDQEEANEPRILVLRKAGDDDDDGKGRKSICEERLGDVPLFRLHPKHRTGRDSSWHGPVAVLVSIDSRVLQ